MHHVLETERAEMVRRSDLARGFACMATDQTTRALMKAKARQYGQAAMRLADAIDGPLSSQGYRSRSPGPSSVCRRQ